MNADWDQYKAAGEEALQEGDFACAETMWLAAYEQAKHFKKFDARFAVTLEGLSEALWHQGKYADAQVFCAETLEIYQITRGLTHPDVGVISNNLAMLYIVQGKYKEAEPLLVSSIEILKQALGADHPEVQNILAHYAEVLRRTGQEEEATKVSSEDMSITSNRLVRSGQYQTLEVDEQLHETEPDVIATAAPATEYTWNQYRLAAEAALSQGDYPRAEINWRCAYKKAEYFEPTDPRLCTTLESLAEVLWKQGKYAEAEPLCRRTMETYEKILDPSHPDVAIIANNLAMLCHAQGKLPEAEALYKRVLPVRIKVLGSNHPVVTNMFRNYANLLRALGRNTEADRVQNSFLEPSSGRWTKTGQYKSLAVPKSEQLHSS